MEIQLKLFAEQMEYQREKDRRVHENAKLSIIKKGEVVECLSRLVAAQSLLKCIGTIIHEISHPKKEDLFLYKKVTTKL